MSTEKGNIEFREPRFLHGLFFAIAVMMAILAGFGLSGGAKYALLTGIALFAIWPISNILRPKCFAAIRDDRFEIVNTETWKTDVFSISHLRRVSLEPAVRFDGGGPEGGVNIQTKLTLHRHAGGDVSYLLPYRSSICEAVAHEISSRLSTIEA
jgi:hypothetical protein